MLRGIGVAIISSHIALALDAKRLITPGNLTGSTPEVLEAIEAARKQRFAVAYDAVVPDTGAVARNVHVGAPTMAVIAVHGLSSRIRRKADDLTIALPKICAELKRDADRA